jgi:hypothetical protein
LLVGLLVDWLIGWSDDFGLVVWLVDGLVVWMFGLLVGCLVGRSQYFLGFLGPKDRTFKMSRNFGKV